MRDSSIASLGRIISRGGYFRRPRFLNPRGALHKEWFHFCVVAPGLEVIVNFSTMGGARQASGHAETARVLVLVRARPPSPRANDGGWEGDVDTVAPDELRVRPGIDASFGASTLRFRDGGFDIDATLADRPADRRLRVRLRLTPLALPLTRANMPLEGGEIHWLVVPRLRADGEVRIGAATHPLVAAPAYHDHNWGRWRWGHDLAWQWGFGLPTTVDQPFSVVSARLVNRDRTREFEHGLILWKGALQHRVFQDGELAVRPEGHFRSHRIAKIPPVMGLLAPGTGTDVPKRLEIVGEGRGDRLRLGFEVEDVAQIIVPNERDLGLTIINEACGTLTLDGRVAGERVEMEGRGLFEFLR